MEHQIRLTLDHIGESTQPPIISPALWAFNEIFGIDRCATGMDTSICAVEFLFFPLIQ